MFKGFYNLTSAMLTHQQNLNVIANNMINVSTAGYKQDRYTASTFDEVMYSRVGNKYNSGEEIGRQSYIRAASDIDTDYTQGTLEPPGLPLDFAINGDGYLCLPGFGQVLDSQNRPIQLGTDKITGDEAGILYYGGTPLARLGVFSFADLEALERNDRGLFTGGQPTLMDTPKVLNGYVERSNTDIIKQMTEMITYQRALQSAAQTSKMYDQLMTKATTDIGRM